jgi:putative ABC transport system permease protein
MAGIGLLVGALPAMRAMRLNIVDALAGPLRRNRT